MKTTKELYSYSIGSNYILWEKKISVIHDLDKYV